jgi:phosphate:Na+ symporter
VSGVLGLILSAASDVGAAALVAIGLAELSAVLLQRGAPRFRRTVVDESANPLRRLLAGLEVSATSGTGIPSIVSLMTIANGTGRDVPDALWTVLGINLGTSIALWVPSLLLFHGRTVPMALILLAVVLPLRLGAASRTRLVAQFLSGTAFLILGTDFLATGVPFLSALVIAPYPAFFGPVVSVALGVVIGAAFSVVARSTAGTVLVAMALTSGNRLQAPVALGIVVGSNVASAVAAALVSRSLGRPGRRVAVHVGLVGMVSVILGVIGMFLLVPRLTSTGDANAAGVPLALALFHTATHLVSMLILAPTAGYMVRVVDRIIPPSTSVPAGGSVRNVTFLPAGFPDSLDANLMLTQSVLAMMAEQSYEMLQIVINASQMADGIEESTDRVIDLRGSVKDLEEKVSVPLARSVQLPCSPAQAERIQQQQRIAQELSLISDDCYKTVRLFAVSYRKNFRFHQESHDELFDYTSRILDFLRYNSDYLGRKIERPDWEIANRMEETIDSLRDKLKKRARKVLEKRDDADIRGELTFIDIISHLEHVGDHCLTIADTVRGLSRGR